MQTPTYYDFTGVLFPGIGFVVLYKFHENTLITLRSWPRSRSSTCWSRLSGVLAALGTSMSLVRLGGSRLKSCARGKLVSG